MKKEKVQNKKINISKKYQKIIFKRIIPKTYYYLYSSNNMYKL